MRQLVDAGVAGPSTETSRMGCAAWHCPDAAHTRETPAAAAAACTPAPPTQVGAHGRGGLEVPRARAVLRVVLMLRRRNADGPRAQRGILNVGRGNARQPTRQPSGTVHPGRPAACWRLQAGQGRPWGAAPGAPRGAACWR